MPSTCAKWNDTHINGNQKESSNAENESYLQYKRAGRWERVTAVGVCQASVQYESQ